MIIIIPMEGQVRTILHSPFLIARRDSETQYSLTGQALSMTGITADMILILPDNTDIAEGQAVTDSLRMAALPLESFIAPSAEDAMADTLGLLLRAAVADGKVTDAELLRVQPALEGRLWQPGIAVAVGDVYTFGAFLWKCVQAHATQGDWSPDLTPALWHKVEIVEENKTRVWAAAIEYAVGDVVAYPDAHSARYVCLQAHTSLEGWEPPNVPRCGRRRRHDAGICCSGTNHIQRTRFFTAEGRR